jgi:hypothetical protein
MGVNVLSRSSAKSGRSRVAAVPVSASMHVRGPQSWRRARTRTADAWWMAWIAVVGSLVPGESARAATSASRAGGPGGGRDPDVRPGPRVRAQPGNDVPVPAQRPGAGHGRCWGGLRPAGMRAGARETHQRLEPITAGALPSVGAPSAVPANGLDPTRFWASPTGLGKAVVCAADYRPLVQAGLG